MIIRLGIDIDGVLADFNRGYRAKFVELTGRDLFRGEEDPPCWEYATAYGYTKDDDAAVWKAISDSDTFWQDLLPYPGVANFLRWLFWRQGGMEVYFITTREGTDVKGQTERWLQQQGFPRPTVLIARGSKGAIAHGIGLTHMLDDRPENLFDMPKGVVRYLKLARYNQWSVPHGSGFVAINNLEEFAAILSRLKQAA